MDGATPLRMVGGDLALRYPERYGFDRQQEREPCSFCGHPTGDCTEEEHLMATKAAAAKKKAPAKTKKPASKKQPAAAPTGDTQGNEREAALADFRVNAEQLHAAERAGLKVVVHDVWEDKPAPGGLPGEVLHILAFHAGEVVNQSQLDAAHERGVKGVKTRAVKEGDLPSVI